MPNYAQVCLVEDDDIMGESLVDRFALEGITCDWHRSASSAASGMRAHRYDVVLSDIRLPDRNGDELFSDMQADTSHIAPWIFITAYATVERAIALMKLGAADYVTKPFDLDQLVDKLRTYIPPPRGDATGPRLGVSPGIGRIEAMLPRLAAQWASVLITGESGVGKEVVAREIHRQAQSSGAFVAVNCGGIPESLLESELFGHERGAFTGAIRQKRGLVEQAAGGTLFLDEIGDMPLSMQVRLLRVLQERQVTRLGSERSVPVEFRLICATHRDLKRMVDERQFREDLFYRINVVHLRVPPLRERLEDIIWYSRQFLAEIAQRVNGGAKRLSGGAELALMNHLWPGNVRELRHCIERAYVLTPGTVIDPQLLFDDGASIAPGATEPAPPQSLSSYLEDCERAYLIQRLTAHKWQMTNTAADIGISRKNLWERLRRLAITPPARGVHDEPAEDE